MAKKGNNRERAAQGVNPQGNGQDTEFATETNSKLERKAKKNNTK